MINTVVTRSIWNAKCDKNAVLTLQFNMYVPLCRVPTEAFEKHTRNLAVSLYQPLHIAVFLHLCLHGSNVMNSLQKSVTNPIDFLETLI